MDTKKQIESLIKNTSHWNGGAGLIIPPAAGKALAKMGIKSGYTISQQVKVTK